ncbi:SDR family NAD(P)-dependent oxidoreductase [Coralloluteibacterium stylophorae]|uniref:SDR family oxidoreductase n=1 Tax=Coralloluteibacterium stylophorae TaxID=1776034 RepID=A0AAP2C9I6_9GAMM|nr:SDR family oxidoreductase [Coralloluteibacterium stylophorae]
MTGEVLVLGATGTVGGGIVASLLEAGHRVIAVGRRGDRLAALREHCGALRGLELLPGSVAEETDGQALAAALRQRRRPLAAVVASLSGGREGGRMLDRPAEFLRRRLDEDLIPHLVAVRHLLPLLAQNTDGGDYVLIGGPGAAHPWSGYGHASIAASAMRMLARVVHGEAAPLGVRVQLLSVSQPVRSEANARHACADWPSARAVGYRVAGLLSAQAPARPVIEFEPPPRRSAPHVDTRPAGAAGFPIEFPRSRSDQESLR